MTGMTLRDPEALRRYVRLMAMSERALAGAAGIGHATLSHLLSGRRATCSTATAQAIESALQAPQGLFFAPTPADRPTRR